MIAAVLSDNDKRLLFYWRKEFLRLLGACFDKLQTFLYWIIPSIEIIYDKLQTFLYWIIPSIEIIYDNPNVRMPMRYPSGFV